MRWHVSLPLLLVNSASHALASHKHLKHHHVMPHAELLEPRDVAWDDHIPADVVVEVRTITQTVFAQCAPTKTIHATLAVNENWRPDQTSIQSSPTPLEVEQPSLVASDATTAVVMTSTIMNEAKVTPVPSKPQTETAPQLLLNVSNLPQLLPAIVPGLPSVNQVLHPEAHPTSENLDWAAIPENGEFITKGFGGRSKPQGSQIQYRGNVGIPWGSNVISVSPAEAHRYKYVVQFTGAKTKPWTVIIWNKIGPDGKMDGWYGHSALTFVLAPGETRYVAFDEDSEGAWGAAPGTDGLPTDNWGGYSSTWGEFSFGDKENNGWSGWDVSAIQAQVAHQTVQGMRICQANGQGCSTITPDAKKVVDAYTESQRHHDGIGGAASPGPVRLMVDIDYRE